MPPFKQLLLPPPPSGGPVPPGGERLLHGGGRDRLAAELQSLPELRGRRLGGRRAADRPSGPGQGAGDLPRRQQAHCRYVDQLCLNVFWFVHLCQ